MCFWATARHGVGGHLLDNTAKPSSGNHVDGSISLPPWLAQQSYWAKVEKSEGARRHTCRNLFLNYRGRFFSNPDEDSKKPAILKSDASPWIENTSKVTVEIAAHAWAIPSFKPCMSRRKPCKRTINEWCLPPSLIVQWKMDSYWVQISHSHMAHTSLKKSKNGENMWMNGMNGSLGKLAYKLVGFCRPKLLLFKIHEWLQPFFYLRWLWYPVVISFF